eukprot:6902299-Prymnesium_polylepis.2
MPSAGSHAVCTSTVRDRRSPCRSRAQSHRGDHWPPPLASARPAHPMRGVPATSQVRYRPTWHRDLQLGQGPRSAANQGGAIRRAQGQDPVPRRQQDAAGHPEAYSSSSGILLDRPGGVHMCEAACAGACLTPDLARRRTKASTLSGRRGLQAVLRPPRRSGKSLSSRSPSAAHRRYTWPRLR